MHTIFINSSFFLLVRSFIHSTTTIFIFNNLCQALAGHTKLQSLRLCENPLGEAGHALLVYLRMTPEIEDDHRKLPSLNMSIFKCCLRCNMQLTYINYTYYTWYTVPHFYFWARFATHPAAPHRDGGDGRWWAVMGSGWWFQHVSGWCFAVQPNWNDLGMIIQVDGYVWG